MRFSFSRRAVLVALVLTPVAYAPGSPQLKDKDKVDPDHVAKMAKGTELFKTSVRAVLQAKCVKCHSGERVEGGFDMNTREALLKGGERGPSIVSGDHKKSLLYQLTAHEKEPKMPYERAKLADADIKKIAEWIDLGAPYDKPFIAVDESAWTKKVTDAEGKKHWAYQPLRSGKPPAGANPIDAFLLDKLDKANLKPNPAADKRTLIRRAYLGLIGLPPTPEQVDVFLKDETPGAYDKVIDGLLASPHFGEKQARHWLDLARFAESHGFEHDYDRPTAYHYRDFVIKALNQDLPFDTFTKWQLAGDEIAPNNPLAMMATGYLAAGVHSTQITKNEAEKHRYDEMDDMLANVGTTFLGLTVGCARCHDHKFDAIPARDYYRMLAAFTTVVRTEVELDLDSDKYAKAKAAFDADHTRFTQTLTTFEKKQLPAKFAAWEKARAGKPLPADAWVLPRIASSKSAGGATLTAQEDGSTLLSGKNPTTETLTFELITDMAGIRSLRLEALSDPSFVKSGPGRAANGNFALSDIRVLAEPMDQKETLPPVRVKLTRARATFEQKTLGVANAIDDNVTTAWAIDPQFGEGSRGRVRLREARGLRRRHEADNHAIVQQQHRARHRPPAVERERRREAGPDRRGHTGSRSHRARDSGRQTHSRANRRAAEVVRPAGRRVPEVAKGRARSFRDRAEAEQGEGADFQRRFTRDQTAHAGRGLPPGDALPEARRPGAKDRRCVGVVLANADAGRGSTNQVAEAGAGGKSLELPSYRVRQLADRRGQRCRAPARPASS